MAPPIIDAKYATVVRLPKARFITSTEAKLAAGPAISSTRAAPGVNPLSISERAIGIEPVAQTYIGTDSASTTSILSRGYCAKAAKKSSGTHTVIRVATTSPITSHRPMLFIMSIKPYRKASSALPVSVVA